MTSKDIRWQQRFNNFERAFDLYKEGAESNTPLSKIESEGLIQRFEYTFELAWKTMKDYMEYGGITANLPREVLKKAFANQVILDGKIWMDMLEKRNLLSHTYDEANFKEAYHSVKNEYYVAMGQLYDFLKSKLNNDA